jgi:methylisocitrate lyase
VRRITYVTERPLLVDADTGFGSSAFNVARTVRELIRAGAAGCHIEDQVQAKRCGHRPGKAIVSKGEMVDRIKAAADARSADFVIMGRAFHFAVAALDKQGGDHVMKVLKSELRCAMGQIGCATLKDLPRFLAS